MVWFIAGATHTGQVEEIIAVVKKLSHIPFASFDIVFAVAGAISIKSAECDKEMW